MLLEHCLQPAAELCVLRAESAISLGIAGIGCPSPPVFLVPFSIVPILPRLLHITLSFPVSLAFFGEGWRFTGVERQAQYWPFF